MAKTEQMEEQLTPVMARMSPDLLRKLDRMAIQERRSRGAQILVLVEEAIEARRERESATTK